MKVLGLSSLSSGVILALSETGKPTHDIRMYRDIFELFCPDDIVLGDRAFCSSSC